MHIYSAPSDGRDRPPGATTVYKHEAILFCEGREFEEAKAEFFFFLGGPLGPEDALNMSWKTEGGNKVAAIKTPCIFAMSRGLIEESGTMPNQ